VLSKNKLLFLFIYQNYSSKKGGHLKIITKKKILLPEKHEKSTRGLKICGTSYTFRKVLIILMIHMA